MATTYSYDRLDRLTGMNGGGFGYNAKFQYDAFGNFKTFVANTQNLGQFIPAANTSGPRCRGQLYDAGTDQVYLRNRYYSPGIGRFTSWDPIGYSGGLNTYNYAGSDPVNRWDPMGTDWKGHIPMEDRYEWYDTENEEEAFERARMVGGSVKFVYTHKDAAREGKVLLSSGNTITKEVYISQQQERAQTESFFNALSQAVLEEEQALQQDLIPGTNIVDPFSDRGTATMAKNFPEVVQMADPTPVSDMYYNGFSWWHLAEAAPFLGKALGKGGKALGKATSGAAKAERAALAIDHARKAALIAAASERTILGKVRVLYRSGFSMDEVRELVRKGVVCFVAGTKIKTSCGFKSIEDIQPGDLVLSRNEKTGEQGYKKVTRVFRNKADLLIHLKYRIRGRGENAEGDVVSSGEIVGTSEHPFWSVTRGCWVGMGQLIQGELLLLANGEYAEVQKTYLEMAKQSERFDTYNFEVEDWHTYFAGSASAELEDKVVWVHNTCSGAPRAIVPSVTDPKLRNYVDNLYKGARGPNPIGTGSTADAVRNELLTGLPTHGRFHSQKAQETINGLTNWLRKNPSASHHDRLVAQSLIDDLKAALGGN